MNNEELIKQKTEPKMRKIWLALGLIGVLLAALLFVVFNTNRWQDGAYQCAHIGNNYYNLEVASDNKSRAVGLSKYQEIDVNKGMLFVFSSNDRHSFWMKDTVFPIDIIWLNSNFTVVDHLTMPVEEDPANPQYSYSPQSPARYAVELKKGEAGDIDIDDTIELVAANKCQR